MSAPVAVVGVGVVTPAGLDIEAHWRAVRDGRGRLAEVSGFDGSGYAVRLAGQVGDFVPEDRVPARLLPQTDRVTRLALTAAEELWAHVGKTEHPDLERGVVLSNAQGGSDFTHREFRKLWTRGPGAVSVYESFAWFYAANTGQISIRYGLRGPSSVLVAEQAGGIDALGHGRRRVRGGARQIVTGGFDSAFDPWGFVSQGAHGRLSREPRPERAYRPFARDATGHVAGEGGALLLLEDASSLRERGAVSWGEVAGYASTFDPPPGGARSPTLRRAIELALADAGLSSVDVVFADAAGLPELDRAEAAALADVFGERGVPVTAPKAGFGRLTAGGGPVDAVTALLALREQVIPPTPYVRSEETTAALDLVVGASRQAELRSAMVLARGYGGFNSALVLTGGPGHGTGPGGGRSG